ncbi:MAG: hypothetical protein IPG94_04785 [Kineosporiaceae bacterium]|nr:hypothetical protein [Kineosporiaceae bacterium]
MEIEHTYTSDMMLTWTEFEAGTPCRRCGQALRDDEPWVSRGTMHLTDDERVRYEGEDARYKAAHGTCRAHRWSIEGSLMTHCGRCCPPPPLSPAQIDRLRVLLRPMAEELAVRRSRT